MYRLLIADDERVERNALRYTVQKVTEAVEEVYDASNGREAVSMAIELRPDICFLDIKMPGSSGIEAAKEIRRQLPGVRIVFLTAFDYFDYAREAIRIGVDDYLVKPASEKNVIEVLRRITGDLDRERSEREHSERVAQKLDLLSAALEAEIAEGIERGFVAAEKLAEFAGLREFGYASLAVAATTVDYESYPMKIKDDSHRAILGRRCIRLMRSLLWERGILAIFGRSSNRIDSICFLAEGVDVDHLFSEISSAIKKHLALATTTTVSSAVTDAGLVTMAVDETQAPPRQQGGPAAGSSSTAASERGASCFPPPAMEGRLLAAISIGDRRAAQTATDDIYEWLSARTGDLRELCRVAGEFFVVIRHSLVRRYPQAMISAEALSRTLASAVVPREVRSALRDQTTSFIAAAAAAGGRSAPLAVRRTREYIELHYSEWVSLERLSQEVGQSTYHLSRLFKRHMGRSIVGYLSSVRIGQAKRLLHEGKLTVKEVSRRVGFTDPTYFARVFRRVEGVSPSAYRDRVAG